MCIPVGAHTGKKGTSDPLEPEIQVFVSHLILMLGSGPLREQEAFFPAEPRSPAPGLLITIWLPK